MYNRWFSLAVIFLWLSMMTWLVSEKILPPLLVGDPPSYQTILDAQRNEPPVGWEMDINGRPMGWAISKVTQLPGDLTQLHSLVHFDELPIKQVCPDWLRMALRISDSPNDLEMDAESLLVVDALGRLSRIESVVRLGDFGNLIHLDGTLEGNQLDWQVKSGTFLYKSEAYLPPNALVGDSLSPQTHLPGLRLGQTWTVPAYSPFRPPNNPIEILQATVEEKSPMSYNGVVKQDVFSVVYRSDPGSRIGSDDKPRGELRVLPDGTVLRQRVYLFDSAITFTRMERNRTIELEQSVGDILKLGEKPAEQEQEAN